MKAIQIQPFGKATDVAQCVDIADVRAPDANEVVVEVNDGISFSSFVIRCSGAAISYFPGSPAGRTQTFFRLPRAAYQSKSHDSTLLLPELEDSLGTIGSTWKSRCAFHAASGERNQRTWVTDSLL